jgi:hypothetical protein
LQVRRWSIFGTLYAIIIASTIVMLVLSIPYGVYAVFYTQLSNSTPIITPSSNIGFFPVYIALLELELPLTPSFGVLFLGLTAFFVLMFVIASVQGGGFIRALVASAREGPAALFRNPLTGMIVILGASLLATVGLQYAQSSVGVQTGGLSGDPFLLLMDFTIAPLIEEVGYRLILIGVPLAVLLLATRPSAKKLLRTLWRPSAAWEEERTSDPGYVSPPTETLKHFAYFLIVLSSIIFGLAHYLSGAGWDIGKVSEAALDGVALAYLYVRYGLHASILYHWAVDYATNAFAFYGQGVYGIPWTNNSSYSLLPTIQVLFLVGLPGILLLMDMFLRRLSKPRMDSTSGPVAPNPVVAPPEAPPESPPPIQTSEPGATPGIDE